MWASCGDMTVAGHISEQRKCYASPPTAVIHILTHDSCAQECPSVGLVWLFECGRLRSVVLAGFGTSDDSSTR